MKFLAYLTMAVLVLAGTSCGDRSAAAPLRERECARLEVPRFKLEPDPDCSVGSRADALGVFQDLRFTPGLCFVAEASAATLTPPGGAPIPFRFVVHAGISSNVVVADGLVPFPVPLVDASGTSHTLISFAAASIIDVLSTGGEPSGVVATRDTGWAEVGGGALPDFASERLVIVGGDGPDYADLRGEIFASGDQFGAGAPAQGSLCGPKALFERLAALPAGAGRR